MQILLCAATEFEINPTIEFISGKAFSNIEVVITGVGLPATTYQLTKKLVEKKPAIVVQAGIAGCLDNKLTLAQVVAVRSESIGDLGVEENGKFNSLFDMKFLEGNRFPWKNNRLWNEGKWISECGLSLVDAVTIHEITTSTKRMEYYRDNLGAQVESMEGAALHYVCLQENVPFLQIRSLSNFVGERDKSKWLMKQSIETLNAELQKKLIKLLDQ